MGKSGGGGGGGLHVGFPGILSFCILSYSSMTCTVGPSHFLHRFVK